MKYEQLKSNEMKKHIIFATMVGILAVATAVLVGCKKEQNSLSTNGKTNQEALDRSSTFFENANNPYDSIGKLHNAICKYVDDQFQEQGFVLTDGVNNLSMSYSAFYQNQIPQNYHVQIETILDYIDEYLFNYGYIDQIHELKRFCEQNDLINKEMTIDVVHDINDFQSSLQNYANITSTSFQSQLINLIFGSTALDEKILAAKNIESNLLSEQNAVLYKNELMLLSVYRHSSGLWVSHAENELVLLPPWVGSDLMGLYSIFWYGASIPNPIGAGIIVGYTALCSAVAAYEFSR